MRIDRRNDLIWSIHNNSIINTSYSYSKSPEAIAATRARALLKENLTSQQWVDYTTTGAFNVIGSDSRRYRISGLTNYGVCSDTGTLLCAYPEAYERLPEADRILGVKLVIEGNVKYFLRVANRKPSASMSRRPRGYPRRSVTQKLRRFYLGTKWGLVGVGSGLSSSALVIYTVNHV